MSDRKIIISCESTVDLPYAEMQKRDIPVLFYKYTIDDVEYEDDMGRTEGFMHSFYEGMAQGKQPRTSQLNAFAYEEFFEKLLPQGDIIHIAFGSGMTKSVQNANNAAQELMAKHPDSRITVIDSLCSCMGYGLIVNVAADMRDEGQDAEAIINRVNYLSTRIHHQFFSADLSHFRRSGRISGPAATLGAILNICPIMHLDKSGHIVAYTKVRGKKAAIEKTLEEMTAHAENGAQYSGPCYIANSDCPDIAEQTRARLTQAFPNMKNVIMSDIGAVIGSHSGPGTVAVFFIGDERSE